MVSRAASVTLLVGVALALPAAPASASTAEIIEVHSPPSCKYPGRTCVPFPVSVLVYVGERGEANRVSTTVGRHTRISDPGAVIEAGEGCASIDRHTVRCGQRVESLPAIFIATGDGADRIRGPDDAFFEGVIMDGGAGDDVLIGGNGGEWLYGGRGADRLRGRAGDDRLHDASPRRRLRDGDPDPFASFTGFDPPGVPLEGPARGRDSFDGGRGGDTVSYEARLADVRVDLRTTAAKAGAPGERDSVRNVDAVVGGAGDDRLSGSGLADHLDGADGDDEILGRGGPDLLEGGAGSNVIVGGPGADRMNPAGRQPVGGEQRISCGTDLDFVSRVLPSDFMDDDCETLELAYRDERGLVVGRTVASHLPLREGAEPRVLSVPIPRCFGSSRCTHQLEVLVHGPAAGHETAPPNGTVLGAESVSRWWYEYEDSSATLSLSPDGLETLRRYGALNVRVMMHESATGTSFGYLTVLRVP